MKNNKTSASERKSGWQLQNACDEWRKKKSVFALKRSMANKCLRQPHKTYIMETYTNTYRLSFVLICGANKREKEPECNEKYK